MTMYNPVSIVESNYNPNPARYRSFTVTCHSHIFTVTVTSTPGVVRYWLYRIRRSFHWHIRVGRLVVGLGVQWTPRYTPGRPLNPPATLQLCVGSKCLIFQLAHSNRSPRALRRFLSDPNISFVGVNNYNDEELLLRESHHELYLSRIIDLRYVAAYKMGLPKKISMENLAGSVLNLYGITKPRVVGESNWDEFFLDEEQVEYASVDAYISFLLGINLRVWEWGKLD